MKQTSSENMAETQIKLIRKYLKFKILEDNVSFRNHNQERQHVYDLLKRTVTLGESHSALMIGPRGCGKTTLSNSVLHQLSQEVDLERDALVVRLNGLLHHDEKVAIKAITAQMQLENAVGDRVFGSYADNLTFLLSCLQTGAGCRSVLFLLEEFHMFCRTQSAQTLLYNLFDGSSAHAPHCVLGITNRIDVMELLEKRVKSRFSHRHIFVFPHEGGDSQGVGGRPPPVASCQEVLVQLLSVPERRRRKKASVANQEDIDMDQRYSLPVQVLQRCKIDTKQFAAMDQSFAQEWNAHIKALAENEKVVDALEKLCYYTVNEQIFRNILYQTVCKLSPSHPYLEPTDLTSSIDNTVSPEHRLHQLRSLSVLELSLVVAMMHGADILDGQPVNFEMVLHRYTKFANTNSSTQTVPRPVILKAFEHLQSLEIILPVRGDSTIDNTASRVQKEYKLYTLAVPHEDIKEAVKGYKQLPTEISQWATNSIE